MKFCSVCGSDRIEFRIPEGDSLPRYVCVACGMIHYQNPKVVVGCLPEWEGQVLLCRRAIEPRHGLWTVPGRVPRERRDGRRRRRARDAGGGQRARRGAGDPYTMISLPHISQVYLIFRARLLDLDFGPGAESLEVRLFDEHEIPWEELAFRTSRGRCATTSSTARPARSRRGSARWSESRGPDAPLGPVRHGCASAVSRRRAPSRRRRRRAAPASVAERRAARRAQQGGSRV